MIRAVVFDLDNTLVDFMKMKDRAVDAAAWAMVDAGLQMTPEDVKRGIYDQYDKYGIESQDVFDKYLTETLGEIDYRVLAAGIIAYRKAREASLQPYPHVRIVIANLLRRGVKLAVLSDAPRREAWLRLCQLGLHHEFDVVVTYEDTGYRKPHPEPFARVIDMLGIAPREAIMVGDWPERDVAGAKVAGLWTVWAKYGSVHAIEKTNADYEIESVDEIVDVIDAIDSRMASDATTSHV
jgi:putative hydrolase of the HAD superfamily